MCGIVGYIGDQNSTPIILNGLKKLEYRGYDSAGIAVLQNGKIEVRRDAGKLSKLHAIIAQQPLEGTIGIGHTRWATHGNPTVENAHPHIGNSGDVVVVHNGIVENYLELKNELLAEGVKFNSETDTETIVHLIELFMSCGDNFETAVTNSLRKLKGAHGIVAFTSKEPDKIIAVRIGNAGGVVVGLGEDGNYVASDIPAILEHTRKMIFLDSEQMVIIKKNSVLVQDFFGRKINPEIHMISWDPVSAEKGEYRHFMQKEIHEQVRSLTDTLAGRVDFDHGIINIPQLNLDPELAKKIEKIVIVACGTAAYAGMVGKIMIETIARIPVEVEIASEFRYRDPIINAHTIVLAISQSGETADTLAAMELAKRKGAKLWVNVNVIGSQAMRISDGFISMQTGPEIGVASTKAFTASLVDLYLLAVLLADQRGTISAREREKYISDLRLVPALVSKALDNDQEIRNIAKEFKFIRNALYLGRGINMPIAFEGALKLKEISYIHAEGYPAGEMKHGPIALVDLDMPVVAIAPIDPWYEKMISQIEQAKARGGSVLVVATEGDDRVSGLADHIFWVPETPWLLSPIVTVIPLQLFAYHIASLRGLDVDQPRNLAKSVTVE